MASQNDAVYEEVALMVWMKESVMVTIAVKIRNPFGVFFKFYFAKYFSKFNYTMLTPLNVTTEH